MLSNNKISILWYSFKMIFILIVFNFITASSVSSIVFDRFFSSSQNEIFSNIYKEINRLDNVDVKSDEFNKIINMCRNSNCTIEVYDTSTNKRLYSPYKYESDIFSTKNSKKIFDDIIGDKNGITVDSSMEEQNTINALNGLQNAYSLVIRKTENIYMLVQTQTITMTQYKQTLMFALLWCLFLSSFIGIIPAYILSRKMLNNITVVKDVAKKLSKNDFSQKCSESRFNEFSELGVYINQMADSLKSQMDEIEDKNRVLESDIIKRKEVEESQKEFISNVSHELKTPISIVSGYAEGIKYGLVTTDDERNKYCDTIISECGRMRDIVKQLLDLSSIEHNEFNIEINNISLLVKSLQERFSTRYPNRNFIFNYDDELYSIFDYDEIEKVLSNYIENAIKYSADDIKINVNDVEFIHIGVISNGVIEEEDREKIWDRFYRADKSHKRSENSTGLGLSIVKATMEKHKMPYGLNILHDSVEFYIELKKYTSNK